MQMGILSDIHDHLANLGAAVGYLNSRAVPALICCGDLCSPFVIDELKKFSGPVDIVFGNNDADLFRITRKCDDRVQAHGELLELERGGRKIAVNHFDNIARGLAASGLYDVVCFGHNHRISLKRYGSTVAINPGPIMGVAFGPQGWEPVPATFAIFDTESMQVSAYRVKADLGIEGFDFP
jgi:uncharacterized protein